MSGGYNFEVDFFDDRSTIRIYIIDYQWTSCITTWLCTKQQVP
jgi:hypothetical protein